MCCALPSLPPPGNGPTRPACSPRVQLVDLMRFYLSFPIHDHTGDPLSEEEASGAVPPCSFCCVHSVCMVALCLPRTA